jgi:hypothetical protein
MNRFSIAIVIVAPNLADDIAHFKHDSQRVRSGELTETSQNEIILHEAVLEAQHNIEVLETLINCLFHDEMERSHMLHFL